MLPKNIKIKILQCLQESKRKEICGFLLKDNQGKKEFHLMNNYSFGSFSFFISDYDFERIKYYAKKNDLKIEALVHSHRSSLNLSQEDIDCLLTTDFPWIVVMLQDSRFLYKVYNKSGFPTLIQT